MVLSPVATLPLGEGAEIPHMPEGVSGDGTPDPVDSSVQGGEGVTKTWI